MLKKKYVAVLLFIFFLLPSLAFAPSLALADEAASPALSELAKLSEAVSANKIALDTVWVLVTAFLVFWMNAGFALVESGLCQAKNTVNILAKNFVVFAIASIAFLVIGWGLMFGDGNSLIGTDGLFFLLGADNSPATGDAYSGVYSAMNWTGVPLYAKFFFQLVFAGTAATIVSGAVAERIKFLSFIVFSFIMVGFIYPIGGHWIWGGGWLALAGVIVLGPRLGKYTKDGRVSPIPGHNMSTATLGALILWLGWFGFNPGSTMAADAGAIARIALTTNTAAAAATLTATLTAWIMLRKPDLSMILNGTLAGLVAITASCAYVSVVSSLIIGLIAGVLVVLAVIMFDKLKLDDPVGALSVHLVNGVFGTLALGFFAEDRFMPGTTGDGLLFGGGTKLVTSQIMGIVGIGVFTFIVSIVAWYVIKAIFGLRVSKEEEMEGLDIGEHGVEAYHITGSEGSIRPL